MIAYGGCGCGGVVRQLHLILVSLSLSHVVVVKPPCDEVKEGKGMLK